MAIVANQTHAMRQSGKFANQTACLRSPNLLTTNMVNAKNGNPAARKPSF
jgi:hypothetical protein